MLLVVGAAHLITQLLVASPSRPPRWDEAVYLSQVDRGGEAVQFVASRARGITFLVAPVLQLGGSLVVVRVCLAAAAAAALTAALWLWVPTIGLAAPIASVLLGFSWLGLTGGSEVMPNLWSALSAVAALGAVARHVTGTGGRWALPTAAGLLALLALFRPPESVPVALAAAALVWAVRPPSRGEAAARGVPGRGATVALLGGGLVAGWLPWIIETSLREGSVAAAVRAASSYGRIGGGSVLERLEQHLSLTDGPLRGPEAAAHLPPLGVLWWAGLVALTVLGLLRARRTPAFGPLLALTAAGALLFVGYAGLVRGLAPRFLLPTYALLSVTAGVGLTSLLLGWRPVRGRAIDKLGPAAAAVFLGTWLWLQVGTAVEYHPSPLDAAARDAGLAIRDATAGEPCLVLAEEDFPQVGLASGCLARPLPDHRDQRLDVVEEGQAAGREAFLVLGRPATPGLASALIAEIPGPPPRHVYRIEPPDPP